MQQRKEKPRSKHGAISNRRNEYHDDPYSSQYEGVYGGNLNDDCKLILRNQKYTFLLFMQKIMLRNI